MARLPVKLLDDIVDHALAVGTISVSNATLVCRCWKLSYQKLLFKSVKVDPLSETNLDLTHPLHHHLVPYIEELCVVRRSDSCPLPNYNQDVTEPFTSFLHNAQNVSTMVFGDSCIQWDDVSSEGIGALRAVFQRSWFRSLEVSVDKPLPYWILLHGLSVGSELTVHCIGPIMPPLPQESAGLVSYQCSLTRLVLFGKPSVEGIAEFCRHQRDLAKHLLRNVDDLVVQFVEAYASRVPPLIPYPEVVIAFLARQLKYLDIRVGSCDITLSHITHSALRNLKALQRLSIYITKRPLCSHDTLISAKVYMSSVLSALPSSSLLRSLSLRIDDWMNSNSRPNSWKFEYQNLLECIYKQLSGARKWPCLTTIHILININDNNVTPPTSQQESMKIEAAGLLITVLLYVNISNKDILAALTPQMS